ncbi:MAG: Flp pilus assembly protein CpaB [Chloroflexi bacterium]|nr:Flp pilus assembly protein CpaB [Chloroflexota bacterium]
MRQRRTGCILMAFGAILALAAGAFVFMTMQQAAAQIPEPKTQILIAATVIPERSRIDPTMVKVVDMAQSLVPPDAMTKPDDAVNRLTLVPIFTGQPILSTQIISTTREAGVASAALQPGKVLVAINFSGAANILTAGAIRPGDTIDLIVKVPGPDGQPVVATTMQNLKVYEIGSVATSPKPGTAAAAAPPSSSPVFIFVVTPDEALELKYLETLAPDLILRAAADREREPDQRAIIDFEFFVQKYGLPRPLKVGGQGGTSGGAPPRSP